MDDKPEVKRYLVLKDIDAPAYTLVVTRKFVDGEDAAIYDLKVGGPFRSLDVAVEYLDGPYETVKAVGISTGKDLAIKVLL